MLVLRTLNAEFSTSVRLCRRPVVGLDNCIVSSFITVGFLSRISCNMVMIDLPIRVHFDCENSHSTTTKVGLHQNPPHTITAIARNLLGSVSMTEWDLSPAAIWRYLGSQESPVSNSCSTQFWLLTKSSAPIPVYRGSSLKQRGPRGPFPVPWFK